MTTPRAPRPSIAGLRRHPILVIGAPDAAATERLERFFELEVLSAPPTPAGLRQRLAGKAALLTDCDVAIDQDFIEGMRWLRAICRSGSSAAGSIDLDACTEAGVIVTASPGDAPERAAENLIAAFGFGRIGGHPPDLINPDVRCQLGCCA